MSWGPEIPAPTQLWEEMTLNYYPILQMRQLKA